MDFVFGTLSTDDLKLYRHRLLRRGVCHQHKIRPQLPKLNEPITLMVTTGSDVSAESVACYYTTDGSDPSGGHGESARSHVIEFTRTETIWDTLTWGYVTRWEATLPSMTHDTLLRYRIGAWGGDGAETFADYPHEKHSLEQAAMRHFQEGAAPNMDEQVGDPSAGTIFALNVPALVAPAWASDAILYHIFVDRFYPGDDVGWTDADDLMGFHGGTLQGIIDKLDYVEALGVNTIWLSPIFSSPSSHGYDATDFREIEPRLGDAETFRALVDAAHERGLRVLLDLACNHLSDEHPYFVDALANSDSPYRDWFTFDEPDKKTEIGYRAFFGVKSLPELNLENPEARDWMIENALYWIREFGIDGYRLDHANGPGPDFWSYFNRTCKALDPDCFCFGEIIDSPDMLQSFVGRLDGLLDFQINAALRNTFGWQSQSADELAHFLDAHDRYYPAEFVRPAFVDNHDMNRFRYIVDEIVDEEAGGSRDSQADLLAALTELLNMQNPPVIYYGTEIGLTQAAGAGEGLHSNRVRMRWGDDRDLSLLKEVKALIRAR